MPFPFLKAKVVKHVHHLDGPGAKGGDKVAYTKVYVHEDDSCRTVEFDRSGKHVHEYDGEPQFSDKTGEPKPSVAGETPHAAAAKK